MHALLSLFSLGFQTLHPSCRDTGTHSGMNMCRIQLDMHHCRAAFHCPQRICLWVTASAVRLRFFLSKLQLLTSSLSSHLLLLTALMLPAQDLYAVEGFSYQEKVSLSKLKLLASSFSTVFAVLQGLPGSLPWGVLLTFLNDFLSQHKNMSIAQATWVRCRRCLMPLFWICMPADCTHIAQGPCSFRSAKEVCCLNSLGPVTLLVQSAALPPGPGTRECMVTCLLCPYL